MTHKQYDVERSIQIINNDTGEFIHIGPDRDAMGGVEIRYHDGKSPKPMASVFLMPEQAALVGNALLELYGREQPTE